MQILDGARVGIGALPVGLAQGVHEAALTYTTRSEELLACRSHPSRRFKQNSQTLRAHRDGAIAKVSCGAGDLVQPGVPLVTLQDDD